MKIGDRVILTGKDYWVTSLIGIRAVVVSVGHDTFELETLEPAEKCSAGTRSTFHLMYNNRPTVKLDEAHSVQEILNKYQ